MSQHKVISLTPLTCILLLISHVTAQSGPFHSGSFRRYIFSLFLHLFSYIYIYIFLYIHIPAAFKFFDFFRRYVYVDVFVGGSDLDFLLKWAGVDSGGVRHTHTGCVTHTSLILRSTHNVSSFRNGVFFLLFFFLNGALCKGRQKAFYSHRLSRHNKYVAPFRNGRFFFSCFSFAQGAILIVITCISFRTGRFLFIYLFIFSCTGSHPYRHHMFPRSACHRAGRFFIYVFPLLRARCNSSSYVST